MINAKVVWPNSDVDWKDQKKLEENTVYCQKILERTTGQLTGIKYKLLRFDGVETSHSIDVKDKDKDGNPIQINDENKDEYVRNALKDKLILPLSTAEFDTKLRNKNSETLDSDEMRMLKYQFDEVMKPEGLEQAKQGFYVDADPERPKWPKNVPVIVEKYRPNNEPGRNNVLVKVGPPCDVSLFSDDEQQEIIKKLVENALNCAKISKKFDSLDFYDFDTVSVSACVAVKGRAQHLGIGYNEGMGNHANAYIKCAGETTLTRWEPRDGPQSAFNDTVCAMVIAMATSQFEYGLRQGGITNSVEATNNILKHPRMETLFDDIQFRRMKDWNSVGECLSGVFGLMCILVEKLMRYVAKAFATVEEKDLFARMRDDKVNPKFAQVTQDFRERMSTVVHNKTEEKTLGATKSATNKNSEKAFSDDFDEVADEQNTSSKPLC